MDRETRVKVALYGFVAERGRAPHADEMSAQLGLPVEEIAEVYALLRQRRLLYLEPDGITIRMAPPFSGVPTQHVVLSGGIEYFANCAWDAFGVVAALKRPGEVVSRCEQSRETLRMSLDAEGPSDSDWRFHCEVPASRWWRDLVYT